VQPNDSSRIPEACSCVVTNNTTNISCAPLNLFSLFKSKMCRLFFSPTSWKHFSLRHTFKQLRWWCTHKRHKVLRERCSFLSEFNPNWKRSTTFLTFAHIKLHSPPPPIFACTFRLMVGRDSSVGIATRYGLVGPGIESRWGARFSAAVQTGPGAHPASCKMDTGSLSRG
jgi:hypothetical protein